MTMYCYFCLCTGVPRRKDSIVRLYVCTSLAYCVQYLHHKAACWHAAAKQNHRTKVMHYACESTYQDHEYIIRIMITKHKQCSSLTLGAMHRRVTVVCLFVCLSVTTSLAHLAAKTLEFGHKWASNHTGMCLN